MRDRMLHDSLRALTEQASHLLEGLLAAGAEIPFEVGDSGAPEPSPGMRGSVTMFAYRPLTAEFVTTHADQLRRLPAFENAAQHLARTRGVIAYLRLRNEPVLDVGELTHARLGVLAFLGAVWQDAERFEHWGDRFERAHAELESVVLAERLVTTVVIPVHGVALREGSINLGAGVELIAAEELDPDCADRFSDSAASADSYCSVSITAPSDAPTPMPAVRLAARAALTALRLFRPGSVALGTTAQAEVVGAWHQVTMPFSGRSREDAWSLRPEDEEELRQFVNAVRRVERRTRIAWALKRFETGLECTVPADGLTDFMLALRALLEADDDGGKAALPVRISALCAQQDERELVRDEVEAAFALERLAVNGSVGRADRKRLAKLAPLEVIAAAERHLRALLHDLVCGYLSTDLKSLADEILSADGQEPGSAVVAEQPVNLEPVPSPGETPSPDPTETVEFDAVFDDTAEIRALDMRADVAAFRAGSNEPAPEAEAPADNVWTLRPADQIAPAPPVSAEAEVRAEVEASFDVEASAEVEASPEAEFGAQPESEAMLSPLAVPAWESSPERRPTAERSAPTTTGEPDGFTFDFQPIPERPAPSPEPAPERTQAADQTIDPAFPIPEFDLPTTRGPVAARSDQVVDAAAQGDALSAIMDTEFKHPERPGDEREVTPVARDRRSHLKPLALPQEPVVAKIVAPDAGPPALLPLDPQMTVEYDVLGAEPSAEEAAQLAWSRQFIRRDTSEDRADLTPVPDVVVAKFPEPIQEVKPDEHVTPDEPVTAGEHVTDGDRTHMIGPATIEFRPLVDADPDDPEDFCGGA